MDINIFYTSTITWFDYLTNGMCWLLIAAFATFAVWIGWDVVTGPRKHREEIKRMLDGLDTIQETTGVGVKKSPFAPDQGKRRKLTTGS